MHDCLLSWSGPQHPVGSCVNTFPSACSSALLWCICFLFFMACVSLRDLSGHGPWLYGVACGPIGCWCASQCLLFLVLFWQWSSFCPWFECFHTYLLISTFWPLVLWLLVIFCILLPPVVEGTVGIKTWVLQYIPYMHLHLDFHGGSFSRGSLFASGSGWSAPIFWAEDVLQNLLLELPMVNFCMFCARHHLGPPEGVPSALSFFG